jgi:two-component system, NtrC family, sensor kinase
MTPDRADPAGLTGRIRSVLRRLRLVWKVNGVFFVILVVILAASSYLTNLDLERADLARARQFSWATSDRVAEGIRDLMLREEPSEVERLVLRMAAGNPAYRDIRLLAHEGRVVAARTRTGRTSPEAHSWPCAACHSDTPAGPLPGTIRPERIVTFPDGERVLSVLTPLLAEEGCSGNGCHTDLHPSGILGLVQADFSLTPLDEMIALRTRHAVVLILVLLLLGTGATMMMTNRLIERRIRVLREGAKRLAAHDYSFKFSDPSEDGIGQLVGVFDSVTSELSETLTELTSAKEHLQAIVEDSADIIITVDPTGLITTFNPGAEAALGYSREEVIGRRIEMLFSDPAERDAAIAQLEHTDHVVNYLTHFVTKDGRVRNVLLTLSRLRSPDGQPIGTLGISKDVTRELRLQRELLRSERMATLGQALTGIQHSIKNMLNNMKGGSYMVKLGLKKDDRDLLMEGWDMVQQGIENMTEMSMSMLEFARTRRLKLATTDLAVVAKEAWRTVEKRYRDEGVALGLEISEDVPDVVCDGEMIRTVLLDLLENAVDACTWKDYPAGEEPEVTIGLKRARGVGYVELRVSDNGVGMTEDVQKKIFMPFFTTKEKRGTGMGLEVVSRIVTSHEGRTSVESEPGQGSTFIVMLPVEGPSQ